MPRSLGKLSRAANNRKQKTTPSSSVVMSNLIDGITINAMPYLAPVAELSETTQLEFCSPDVPQDLVGEALSAFLDPSHMDDHSTDDLVNTTVASDDRENEDSAPIAAEDDGEDDDNAPVAEVVEDGPPIDLVDWSIKGVEGLEGDALCHMKAFYGMLKETLRQKDSTSVLLSKMTTTGEWSLGCTLSTVVIVGQVPLRATPLHISG
jgi:hypothetical protein